MSFRFRAYTPYFNHQIIVLHALHHTFPCINNSHYLCSQFPFFNAAAMLHFPVIISLVFALASACRQPSSTPEATLVPAQSQQSVSPPTDTTDATPGAFTFRIITAPENTFGYQILSGKKILINQPHIPGMPGIKGFITQDDAANVARLVISKLEKNQMPPTVTLAEMKKLGIVLPGN
ncbi:MAG TPA: DUF4907 domain-containing protein [Chitinophagales bacterium]|nr:DUF4907 domain-containing protein [Chitinophagales bacterium]